MNFDTEFEISSVGILEISLYTKSEQRRVAAKHLTRHAKTGYAAVATAVNAHNWCIYLVYLFNWSANTITQTPTYSRKMAKSKMLCFKFKQNLTINEEFYFFDGWGGGRGGKGTPFIYYNLNYYS